MDEHDQRRRPRHELQVNGTLRLLEEIEPWEHALLLRALAKPGATAPATRETHDDE